MRTDRISAISPPPARPVSIADLTDPVWLAGHLGDILDRETDMQASPAQAGPLAQASVLVPIVLADPPFILLTKRAASLRHHPGQVSFPGGRIDPADRDCEYTALREAHEEIALSPAACRVVGRLPLHVTTSDFHVTPVVALVRPEAHWAASPSEVEEILTLPLADLLDPDAAELHGGMFRGTWHEYWVWRHPAHMIWGATGAILMSLAEILRQAARHPVAGPV